MYQCPLSWNELLADDFCMSYMEQIHDQIVSELAQGISVFPPQELIFNALELCPPQNVKVVILGQDPYHGIGQAHGLSFSVAPGISLPPSLKNIFKELVDDLSCPQPRSGNLEKWAHQGVLLLNASLTVQEKSPMSHAKIGWSELTDSIIYKIARHQKNVVFVLWGSFARSKKPLIEGDHLILECVHPSPLSAYQGFFGSKPFSQANTWLIEKGIEPVDWVLVGNEQMDLF